MSKLKFSPNLFLEQAELEHFQKFITDEGFKLLLKNSTTAFGIIKNTKTDASFNNFKVEAGTNPGTIKFSQDSYAVDSNFDVITQRSEDNIDLIPAITNFYWLKVAYNTTPVQVGTVSIDASGNLTGVGTNFTEILRGQPNFPAKIKFTNASLNTIEYEVVDVVSDTSAVLAGDFVSESALSYKVVGTFTPGSVPSASEKDPFVYDSVTITAVLETVADTAPAGLVADSEFWIARVSKDGGGVVTITDKRSDFWRMFAKENEDNAFTGTNTFAGQTDLNGITNMGRISNWAYGSSVSRATSTDRLDLNTAGNSYIMTDSDSDNGNTPISFIESSSQLGTIIVVKTTTGKSNTFNNQVGGPPVGYSEIRMPDSQNVIIGGNNEALILLQTSSQLYQVIGGIYKRQPFYAEDFTNTTVVRLKKRIIEIGDWNMDTTFSVSISHGLNIANIREVLVMIRNDAATELHKLDRDDGSGTNAGNVSQIDGANISLARVTTGFFDSVNYDSTSYNRGWITITHVA